MMIFAKEENKGEEAGFMYRWYNSLMRIPIAQRNPAFSYESDLIDMTQALSSSGYALLATCTLFHKHLEI